MTSTEGRVAGAYLLPLLEAAGAHGIAAATLAHAAGVAPHSLEASAPNLAARDYVRLLDAGAMLAGDAHFGLHVGQRVRMGTYSAYGLILLSCSNVGQGGCCDAVRAGRFEQRQQIGAGDPAFSACHDGTMRLS